MRQALDRLHVQTRGQGFVDVTPALSMWLARQGVADGLLTVWCRHTSASLLVQENADPDVRADLEAFLRRLAPEDAVYRHADEGPDDMPAHIRAALMPTQLSVPVESGRLGARHLAGDLPRRAPARTAPTGTGAAPDRRLIYQATVTADRASPSNRSSPRACHSAIGSEGSSSLNAEAQRGHCSVPSTM